jgi:hypothetical protein
VCWKVLTNPGTLLCNVYAAWNTCLRMDVLEHMNKLGKRYSSP